MKKLLYAVVLVIGIPALSFGQGFYFRGGLGFAVPQASQTIDPTGQPFNGSINHVDSFHTAYNLKNASFSSGLQGSIGGGYLFNEHVGIDMTLGIGLSTKKYTYSESNLIYNGVTYDVQIEQQAKSPIILMPALVLQSGGEKMNIYTRFGLVLPLKTMVTQDFISVNHASVGQVVLQDVTSEISNSFSLGFTGTAGAEYQLSEKIALWGEVSLLSLSVFSKESNITQVTQNGQLKSLVLTQTKTTYSKNYTSADSDTYHQPAYSLPFSNVSFNVGVRVKLGSKRHNSKVYNSSKDGNFKRRGNVKF